ncbi:MAG: hypothetical protein ACRC6B_10300 [Fusobacteriaceae bacterium]
MKQYYYIGKKEALKNLSMVYAVSDERIQNYKTHINENAIEFYGDNLPYYVTVLEDETVREATTIELYKNGIYELCDYEFVNGDKISTIYDFEIPEEGVNLQFNYDQLKWIETATDEELIEAKRSKDIRFYNQELKLANRAMTELACMIISETEFDSVKNYMRAIDPYIGTKLTIPSRPSVFDRYN